MIARTHLCTGVTAGAFVAVVAPVRDDIALLCGLAVVLGSITPDVDHAGSYVARAFGPVSWLAHMFVGHRGPTHQWHGNVAFGLLWFVVLVGLNGPIGDHAAILAASVTVGCAVHCWGDARTLSGVRYWWWPGRTAKTIVIGKPFRTGSKYETKLRHRRYRPIALVSVVAALLVTGAFPYP